MTSMPQIDLTQLKSQITTMFFMKGGNGSNSSTNDKLYNDVFMMLYTICIVNGIEYIFRIIPNLFISLKVLALAYLSKKSKKIPGIMNIEKKEEITASITLHRVFNKENKNNENVEKIDGIINYISNLDSVKHIRLDGRTVLNNKEEIMVLPNIHVKILELNYDDDNELSDISLLIYSHILKISDLLKWIDEVYQDYCFEKNNKLGKKKFYFNEIPIEPPCYIDSLTDKKESSDIEINKKKKYRLEAAPKNLHFTMNEFNTCKSFINIFGDHVSELKERLDLFVNHPEWYMTRGIPHSLGILLHGIPGAGKTSTIKAIAKDTNRHIFNLSLREYTTQKQLLNLFFNENIIVMNDEGHKQTYRIPLNQRIFVIEDIDCLTNIVYQRSEDHYNDMQNKSGDGINLSFILNLLDGVLETPGRVLIITSNYPDKLDKALIRPGRIDVKVEFKKAPNKMIADIINNFYSVSINSEDIPEIVDSMLSPAEVLECVCTYFKDYNMALECMKQKAEKIRNKEIHNDISLNNKVILHNDMQFSNEVAGHGEVAKEINENEISANEINENEIGANEIGANEINENKIVVKELAKVNNQSDKVNKNETNNDIINNNISIKRVLSSDKNNKLEEYLLAEHADIQPNIPMSVEYLSLISENIDNVINNENDSKDLGDFYKTISDNVNIDDFYKSIPSKISFPLDRK